MGGQKTIRVMVVDDHAVIRSGLGAFLMACDGLEQVGEAASGDEAVRLCPVLQPDVILMDLVMPGMDGATATREIRRQFPGIQIIILTSFKEQNLVEEALQAGAIGYLLKNVSVAELDGAIRAAVIGKPTLAPEATQALIGVARRAGQKEYDLTSREKEILNLMASGLSNPEIADRLIISRSTVKFHVSGVLAKLDVSSRTEAVTLALQKKLIEYP